MHDDVIEQVLIFCAFPVCELFQLVEYLYNIHSCILLYHRFVNQTKRKAEALPWTTKPRCATTAPLPTGATLRRSATLRYCTSMGEAGSPRVRRWPRRSFEWRPTMATATRCSTWVCTASKAAGGSPSQGRTQRCGIGKQLQWTMASGMPSKHGRRFQCPHYIGATCYCVDASENCIQIFVVNSMALSVFLILSCPHSCYHS